MGRSEVIVLTIDSDVAYDAFVALKYYIILNGVKESIYAARVYNIKRVYDNYGRVEVYLNYWPDEDFRNGISWNFTNASYQLDLASNKLVFLNPIHQAAEIIERLVYSRDLVKIAIFQIKTELGLWQE